MSRAWPILAFVLAWPWSAAAGDAPGPTGLPWAAEAAESTVAGLTVRAHRQSVETRPATLHSMQFRVTNPTQREITLEVKQVELLSAQARSDRGAKTQQCPLRSWWIDQDGVIKLIRKDGRLPALVQIPANKQLRLFVGGCEVPIQPDRRYWRRGTFEVAGHRLRVTGPIVAGTPPGGPSRRDQK